ncbi:MULTISPECIES: TetR/AcrR family transcriptional regulator [Labrys]|uniref:TetR/AcrR family transcriptional regulator n=1 Tax=Labrys neptuniae TaxID=376174 RepID=A0ABV3PFL2_9HYPH
MQNSEPKPETGVATGPVRGRPRAFDRTAALEQATRLFWCKGFEATSIADLTQAMGIGAPSLYAAFQSKEALYAEALRHYAETNESYVWAGFQSAATARDAVRSILADSAAALTGCVADIPRGCMVTLSSVGSEGHAELGELVRSARAVTLERLLTRFSRAVADGEIPVSTDLHALARFVQTVQNGMSILARDGVSCAELEAVADVAMAGWDVRTAKAEVEGG